MKQCIMYCSCSYCSHMTSLLHAGYLHTIPSMHTTYCRNSKSSVLVCTPNRRKQFSSALWCPPVVVCSSVMFLDFFQVPFAVGERPNCRTNSSSVFQREVQPAAQIPPPALPSGGPGAETHLPAPGGQCCRPHILSFCDQPYFSVFDIIL